MGRYRKHVLICVALLFGVWAMPRARADIPASAPGNIQSTVISTSEIDLSWSAVTANPPVTGYKIERETPVGGGFTTIVANTGSTDTVYVNAGLAPGTTYNYRVSAINSDGIGPPSSSASAITFGPPIQFPAAVQLAVIGPSGINVSWSAVAANPPVTGYKIERESPVGGGFTTIVANTGSTATSYADTNLSPNTVYNYRVSAINNYGIGVPSVTLAAATTYGPPTYAPDLVTATAVSSSEVDLSWSAVTANPAVTGYKIERESPIGGGFTTIVANTGSTATSYANTNLSPNTAYNYRISAINSGGAGLPSAKTAAATTLSVPAPYPPSSPTNLTAVAASSSVINLSWTAAQSDSAITGYRIERDFGGGFTTILANSGSSATSYSDVNLSPGITYMYRVSAANVYGMSNPSRTAVAATPVPPAAPQGAKAVAGDGQATVTWLPPYYAVTGGITGYLISGTPSSSASVGSSTLSATITGLTNGVVYSFSVSAVNLAGPGPAVTTNTVIPKVGLVQQPVTTTTVQLSPASNAAPTAPSFFYFSFTLQKGMRGQAVTELQNRLTWLGFYSGPVTGYFGVLTEAAVTSYQRAHYLPQVGVAGPLTRAFLNANL
jgi:titin